MRIPFFIIALVLVAPHNLFAQTRDTRGSIAAIAGAGRTWDDESQIGSGAAVGGRVDWRLIGNTRVEGAVELFGHDRNDVFQAHGHTVLASASLVQRFGAAAVQPYVLGGVTVAHHSGTTQLGTGPTRRHTSTDTGYHFGGGLAVRLGQRFEIGPEARFYILQADNDSDPAWADWFGVRFGVRF